MPRKKQEAEDWMPRCGSCAFFVGESSDDTGECRRLPPAIFPDGENAISFSFAITKIDQWCGEFKRRCDS